MDEPSNSPPTGKEPGWERDIIARLAQSALVEQRRARRWNIALRLLFLAYLVFVTVSFLPKPSWPGEGDERHTALIEVNGTIADDSDASADRVITGLRAAFEDEATAGVILRINSPGGSPVQAGYIADEIRRLREKYPQTKVYAVVTDMAASGGYYVAAMADAIYADKGSLLGSIGVVMNGFGFVGAMEKLGIERRLLTAGEHKGFLDPFSPERPEEVAHFRDVLGQVHQQFIAVVRQGRGERLKGGDELFSGLLWTGERAVELGLADGLGSASHVAREVIGAEKIVDYTPTRGRLTALAERIGASIADRFLEASVAGWRRY
ncbi:MAG: S49 family peptidase [Ectothiorhodospiraceae bacterium]|nr:S49 family peptidase [Ectothiorhodospiraceae bacterium]